MKTSDSIIEEYRKIEIAPGIILLMTSMVHARTVATGLWFRRGSRDEFNTEQGITHLIEHMVFKGSHSHTAYQMAKRMDLIGGHFDAGTGKEFTCFFTRCLDEDFDESIELLFEIVFQPSFPVDELNREKEVIIEEIKMSQDDPEDFLFEQMNKAIWKTHPLGYSITGTESDIGVFNRDLLLKKHDQLIRKTNLIISIAGNIDVTKTEDNVRNQLRNYKFLTASTMRKQPEFCPCIEIKNRNLEQVYFVMAMPWFNANHPSRFAAHMANIILGGNMSSILFQKLREQYGLTYNIGSMETTYTDAGLLEIFGSTRRENFSRVLKLCMESLSELTSGLVNLNDFNDAKRCLKGNIVMTLEGTSRRMSMLAREELYNQNHMSVSEILDTIDKIEFTDYVELVDGYLRNSAKSLVALGPFNTSFEVNKSFDESFLTSNHWNHFSQD